MSCMLCTAKMLFYCVLLFKLISAGEGQYYTLKIKNRSTGVPQGCVYILLSFIQTVYEGSVPKKVLNSLYCP